MIQVHSLRISASGNGARLYACGLSPIGSITGPPYTTRQYREAPVHNKSNAESNAFLSAFPVRLSIMASIQSAPPTPSKEESKPISEPAKNGDNKIKPGQAWIWGFTVNEIALVILQIVATVIAAIFGAWAIRSYDSAKIANELSKNSLSESRAANMLSEAALNQTSMANQLAILALCQIDPVSTVCRA